MFRRTKRAKRRHHLNRMKQKAMRVYYFLSPHEAKKYANHLKSCSCYGCGNRRRTEGKSLAERRFEQKDKY